MFSKFDNLGEKTINKIAEVALSSQLKETEQLKVNVKTDPNLLAKGMLESLVIDCQGLIAEKSLRMETINITLKTITVSPFKALMGKIELTQPSQGTASILLTEADLTRALDAKIRNYQSIQVQIENQSVSVNLQDVNCQLLETDKILITTKVWFENTEEMRNLSLRITPCIYQLGNGVVFENVEYLQEPALSSIILNPIVEEANNIFNLQNFKVDGFFLKVKKFTITQGGLQLQAEAGMTHFPTT